MRIKPLSLAVALLAAETSVSVAQVGSINIVGYINLPVQPGLNLIVNQLASTMVVNHLVIINNDLNAFMPSVPDGAVVFRYDPVGQAYADGITFLSGAGWYPASGNTNDPIKQIPVGEGFFLQIPGSNSTTVTFAGEVVQDSVLPIPGNYSLIGSVIPQAAKLGFLNFTTADGDHVYQWDALLQRFKNPLIYSDATGWQPDEPGVVVGESFLIWRDPTLAIPARYWVRHFSVGQTATPTPLAGRPLGIGPVIQKLALSAGQVTLDIGNPGGGAYDIEFSNNGLDWQTVAEKQAGPRWSAPFIAGSSGYFRLSAPKNQEEKL